MRSFALQSAASSEEAEQRDGNVYDGDIGNNQYQSQGQSGESEVDQQNLQRVPTKFAHYYCPEEHSGNRTHGVNGGKGGAAHFVEAKANALVYCCAPYMINMQMKAMTRVNT